MATKKRAARRKKAAAKDIGEAQALSADAKGDLKRRIRNYAMTELADLCGKDYNLALLENFLELTLFHAVDAGKVKEWRKVQTAYVGPHIASLATRLREAAGDAPDIPNHVFQKIAHDYIIEEKGRATAVLARLNTIQALTPPQRNGLGKILAIYCDGYPDEGD